MTGTSLLKSFMFGQVKPGTMSGAWVAATISLLLLLSSHPVRAQEGFSIKDPTVPPAAWLAAQAKSDSVDALSVSEGPRVGVIVIGKVRKVALVDGRVVQPGDVMGGSRVATIEHNRVVLDDEGKTLSVTPNVEKKSPSAPAAKKKTVVIQTDVPSSKQ